jgi:glucose-1-phosphate cytidylyltransferase
MKVVLFCGGMGMRMREYSDTIPKPLVPIGSRPIIWHLMKYYAHYGHKDFVLCLGYRGEAFKQYFLEYKEWVSNDFVLSDGGKQLELMNRDIEDWRISFVQTGIGSNIGERLMAVRDHLDGEDVFLANYSDGLTDLPLDRHIEHFRRHGKIASFLCTKPSQTFHVVDIEKSDRVTALREASSAGMWVNAGFFVFKSSIFEYMRPGEELVFKPFERLIQAGELVANRYDGFWAGVDTFKDRQRLEDMIHAGEARWMLWDRKG